MVSHLSRKRLGRHAVRIQCTQTLISNEHWCAIVAVATKVCHTVSFDPAIEGIAVAAIRILEVCIAVSIVLLVGSYVEQDVPSPIAPKGSLQVLEAGPEVGFSKRADSKVGEAHHNHGCNSACGEKEPLQDHGEGRIGTI